MSDDEWEPDEAWDDPGASGSGGRPSLSAVDPASAVVGTLVGLAGFLLVIAPTVRTVSVLGTRMPTFVLSAGVLSFGFAVGAPVYLLRGFRLRGLAHAIGAVGFGALFLAAGVGSPGLVALGLAVVLGGALFLVAETRKL
ncbi:hypothetical protein [Natronomonas marina]|uniref:hypothetical protein n=1 Tax=Natronomonas marina TaxID=2961939 RepID=UPI0020C9FE1E|nr:hypothetical protein [Natronomonas marina]